MIKHGHIGAACAFRDLGYSPEMVKFAFMNQGLTAEEADYLVKEAFIPQILGAIGGTLGRAALSKAPGMVRGVGQGILKAAPKQTTQAAMQSLKKTPGLLRQSTQVNPTGAATGSLTGKLMQGGGASQMAGKALHHVGSAAQHGLSGFQGGIGAGLKNIGGGVLNFGKGMFFMGSKKPSLANMAGKGVGAYGMGSMLFSPGSTPMPTPQMQG